MRVQGLFQPDSPSLFEGLTIPHLRYRQQNQGSFTFQSFNLDNTGSAKVGNQIHVNSRSTEDSR